jgi:hypothetical protein
MDCYEWTEYNVVRFLDGPGLWRNIFNSNDRYINNYSFYTLVLLITLFFYFRRCKVDKFWVISKTSIFCLIYQGEINYELNPMYCSERISSILYSLVTIKDYLHVWDRRDELYFVIQNTSTEARIITFLFGCITFLCIFLCFQ